MKKTKTNPMKRQLQKFDALKKRPFITCDNLIPSEYVFKININKYNVYLLLSFYKIQQFGDFFTDNWFFMAAFNIMPFNAILNKNEMRIKLVLR